MKDVTRRRALLGLGIGVVAGSAASCARSGAGASWRFLTADEARTLEAACAQIIPADRDPGAKEAGVVNYIDNQLSTRFRKHRAAYRQGIAGMDAASRSQYGKPFADLSSDQQVEILNATEEKSRAFFELLLNHTRQGFYGDPRHGGNRGMASWRWWGCRFPRYAGGNTTGRSWRSNMSMR
jgi:gluconate 2-dehydrogenase gamma chain